MLASSASKRIPTKPKYNEQETIYDPRMEGVLDDINEVKKDLDECKDVKSKMEVLDERTNELMKRAQENRNALFGANGTPGVLTRLSNVEMSISDIKRLVWAVLIGVVGVVIEQIVALILSHGPTIVNAAK